jgi:hypothetical protein
MTDTTTSSGATAIAEVPIRRACTRCNGEQVLSGGSHGLGKFLCDTCTMAVGFDLEAEPAEFLLDRGSPSRYTKDLFGSRLLPSERRLP